MAKTFFEIVQTTHVNKILENPSPCDQCGCPWRWSDRYGGGPWCQRCVTPMSTFLVGRREVLENYPGDGARWRNPFGDETGEDEMRVKLVKNPVWRFGSWGAEPDHLSKGCPRCRCTDSIEVVMHDGESRRVDCARCGLALRFSVWRQKQLT